MKGGKQKPPGRLGAGEKCPLCSATSGVTDDDDGFACLQCGGPRILVDPPIARKGAEKPLLERAKQLRARRAAWGVAAGVAMALAGFAVIVSGVMALIIHLGAAGGEVAAASVLAPLLFAALAFSRVRGASGAARSTLDAAELVVVGELVRARNGSLEAADLAAILHVPVARAEQLCAETQVEGFLTEGEAAPPIRARVEADPDPEAQEPADDDRRNRAR